jgi:hypothetical protein
MKYGIISYIGMIFTFLIILLSLFGPWYNLTLSALVKTENVDMSLTHIRSYIGNKEQLITYDNFKDVTSIVGINTDKLDIFKDIRTMVVISLFLTVIGIIVILWLQFISIKPEILRYFGIILCLIVFLINLIACLYFMAGVFHEGDGFWFTKTILGIKVTGSPAYGWFFLLITSFVSLISSIPLAKKQIE